MAEVRPLTVPITVTVQCMACGTSASPSRMDEGADEDGVFWTCMNRAECLARVRTALARQPVPGYIMNIVNAYIRQTPIDLFANGHVVPSSVTSAFERAVTQGKLIAVDVGVYAHPATDANLVTEVLAEVSSLEARVAELERQVYLLSKGNERK